MKNALRLGALAVAVVGLAFWFFGGPHLGRTQTQIVVTKKDPSTQLESQDWEPRFIPGLDFVAGVLGISVALFGAARFLPASKNRPADRARS